MRRPLALLTLLAIAAFAGGCSSLHDTGSSNTNSNTNTVTTGAAPTTQPASSNTATVGGARPPQAKPSPTSEAGIKPPTRK